MVHGLGFFKSVTFNAPSWSISVEFYTYLIFLVDIFVAKVKRVLLCLSAAILTTALAALLYIGPQAGSATVDFGIVRCIAGFFLGVIIFETYEKLRKLRFNPGTIDVLAVVSVFTTAAFLSLKHPGYSDLFILPCAAAIILSLSLSPRGYMTGVLQNRFLVKAGTLSYAIYMAHASVLWGVNQALRVIFHGKEVKVPLHGTLTAVPASLGSAALIIAMALILIVAYLAHI